MSVFQFIEKTPRLWGFAKKMQFFASKSSKISDKNSWRIDLFGGMR
jgi:hypothetical protein